MQIKFLGADKWIYFTNIQGEMPSFEKSQVNFVNRYRNQKIEDTLYSLLAVFRKICPGKFSIEKNMNYCFL